MQQKQQKNERREMARDAVWWGGIDSVDGFVGWVDTGIYWCYDGAKEPSIAPTTLAKPANA